MRRPFPAKDEQGNPVTLYYCVERRDTSGSGGWVGSAAPTSWVETVTGTRLTIIRTGEYALPSGARKFYTDDPNAPGPESASAPAPGE